MRTLIGIATFGGIEFTRLAVNSIRDTVTNDYDIFIVANDKYNLMSIVLIVLSILIFPN